MTPFSQADLTHLVNPGFSVAAGLGFAVPGGFSSYLESVKIPKPLL